MKLNSNRKNVGKIVAAASSSVLFSSAPAYQLNGVGNDFPAVENLRDALKSNMGLGTFKNWIVTSLNNRVLIPVKNTAVDVAKWKVFRFPLGLLRSAACKVLSSCFRNSQERSTTKQLPHHVDNFKKSEDAQKRETPQLSHVYVENLEKSLPRVNPTEPAEPLPAFSKQPSQPRVDNLQKSKIAESIQAHNDSSCKNEVAKLMDIVMPAQNTEPLPLQSDQPSQPRVDNSQKSKIAGSILPVAKPHVYEEKPLEDVVHSGEEKQVQLAGNLQKENTESLQAHDETPWETARRLFKIQFALMMKLPESPEFSVESLNCPKAMLVYLERLLELRKDLPEYNVMRRDKRNLYIKEFLKQAQLKLLSDDDLRDLTRWMIRRDVSVLEAMVNALPRPITFPFDDSDLYNFLLTGGRDGDNAIHLQPQYKQQVKQLRDKMNKGSLESVLLHLLERIRHVQAVREVVQDDYYDKLNLILDKMTPAKAVEPGNIIGILARDHFLVDVYPRCLKDKMVKAITDVYGE